MFKNLGIKTKLIAVLMLVGLIPLGTIAYIAQSKAKAALQEQVFTQLASLRDVRCRQIENYIRQRLSDVQMLAGNPIVVSAVQDYEDAFVSGGVSGSECQQVNRQHAEWLRQYEQELGYEDLYLVGADGDVVFSVDRASDLGANLISGRYARENIGELYVRAQEGVAIVDLAAYPAKGGAPASFVGAPIVDAGGGLVGEVLLQIPLERLSNMLQERSGLGASGETYLVGADQLMRSDSRFSDQPTTLKRRIETATCKSGLAGGSGLDIVPGPSGASVLSAYAPLSVAGLDWCLLAEINESEAFRGVTSLQNALLIGVCLNVLLLLVVGWLFAQTISRPIVEIARVARDVATGDVDHHIEVSSRDEVGVLAASFRDLIAYMKTLAAAAERIADNDLTVKIEPKSDKDVLGRSFKTMAANLSGVIRRLGDNAGQLVSAATEISSSSEQMSHGAANQAQQVRQVATAIEEMAATIVESARNAGDATETSRAASDTAAAGGQIVSDTIKGMQRIADTVRQSAASITKLAQSADQIGEIIGVIDEIADQTNLLALNAAIEAARAGEQGRGFAVVADEVRKLAERTGKATGEIAGMIKGIQKETEDAVTSMQSGIIQVDKGRELADKAGNSLSEIVNMSQRVMDMVRQIATAADEQSTAADEISKNVELVSSITKETATGAEQSAAAAEVLNRQAESLRELMSRFKIAATSAEVDPNASGRG